MLLWFSDLKAEEHSSKEYRRYWKKELSISLNFEGYDAEKAENKYNTNPLEVDKK